MTEVNKENLDAYINGFMYSSIGEEDEYSRAVINTCKCILERIEKMSEEER